MSTKPSRSEIENALTSNQRAIKRESRKPRFGADAGVEPGRRRQQVIGGDLTGVANRRNNRRFAWLRKINLVNWVAVVIVLLILLAFFWPTQDSGSTREIAEQNKLLESESFYSESRVDEQAEDAVQSQTFNRETDIDRADQFRSQDAIDRRIRDLVELAQQQLANGQYTQPEDNNASNTFKQVLLLSANNVEAEQGLEYIRGRFLTTGLAALEKDNSAAAQSTLTRLSKIDNQSEEFSQLESALELWNIESKSRSLLALAETARSEQKLILPARENALYYFQQVLELDEENQDALSGIQKIADSFIEKANRAIGVGTLQSAAGYLATASVIDPEHPSLPLMEELLSKAGPLSARAGNQSPANQRPANQSAANQNNPPVTQNTTNANANKETTPPPGAATVSAVSEEETIDRQLLNQGLEAYYKGEYQNAAALLQPLADKGVSRAQFRIGYMYFQGRGFDTNRTEADRIIRAALPAVQNFADEGRAWAQSDIGSLYEDGLVLPKDYGEAVYWYRSAAEQGYPGAQTNLGIMYARGRGVSSSRRTAIEWFQRAAKQGDELARRNLESMGINP